MISFSVKKSVPAKESCPPEFFRENAQSPAALFGEYAEKAARMTPIRDLLLLFG